MNRSIIRLLLLLQGVLLLIELFVSYDTTIRQVALAATNVLGTALIIWVNSRFARSGQSLPALVSWLGVTGIWFDAAGNFAHFYSTFPWWDKLAHFVGTAAVAGAVWVTLRLSLRRAGLAGSAGLVGLSAVGVATLLSVVYEITEYLGDLIVSTHRVTDLYDTADDLLWNCLAAALTVTLFTRWYRARGER